MAGEYRVRYSGTSTLWTTSWFWTLSPPICLKAESRSKKFLFRLSFRCGATSTPSWTPEEKKRCQQEEPGGFRFISSNLNVPSTIKAQLKQDDSRKSSQVKGKQMFRYI